MAIFYEFQTLAMSQGNIIILASGIAADTSPMLAEVELVICR